MKYDINGSSSLAAWPSCITITHTHASCRCSYSRVPGRLGSQGGRAEGAIEKCSCNCIACTTALKSGSLPYLACIAPLWTLDRCMVITLSIYYKSPLLLPVLALAHRERERGVVSGLLCCCSMEVTGVP